MTEMEYLALIVELESAFAALGEPMPKHLLRLDNRLFLADIAFDVDDYDGVMNPMPEFAAIRGLRYGPLGEVDDMDFRSQPLGRLAAAVALDFRNNRRATP
jgi:hypothetical protein